ncbi:MAG: zinc ribbon domain-containing protein [Clostridiales bacterium]
MCKCGFKNIDGAKFCSNCGTKLINENLYNFPKMITVKESYETVFMKKISITKIYELIKTKSLPHVNAGGKLLLDLDTTIKWWNDKLNESTKPQKFHGLKEIV